MAALPSKPSKGGDAVLNAIAGLSGKSQDERSRAIKALETFSKSEEKRNMICASGGAVALVQSLARNLGVSTAGGLGGLGTNSREASRACTPAQVAQVMMPHERMRYANAIGSLAETASCRTVLLNAGVLAPLLRLFGGSAEVCQEAAARALKALVPAKRATSDMLQAGLWSLILKRLSSDDAKVRARVADLLTTILALEKDEEERLKRSLELLELGILTPLLSLLSRSQVAEAPESDLIDEASVQVCLTLGELACDNETKNRIIEAGTLPILLSMLQAPDSSCKESVRAKAAVAVATIFLKSEVYQEAPAPNVKELFIEAGFLSPMVALFQSKADGVLHDAAHALFLIASRYDMQAHLINAGALPGLVRMMKEGPDAQCRAWAIAALRCVATTAENREAIERAVPMKCEDRDQFLKSIATYCY
eukprot:TRINITY_DN33802_c0_g1_i1.p1 TRINITY_DN33802_c0_g1~~TRINITY_DN33802_c0_g1_i1.p1  ORF type:complete len:440 (-),score=95.74 TRINITY_DN33802_c0_g1_i1:80-1351(-)